MATTSPDSAQDSAHATGGAEESTSISLKGVTINLTKAHHKKSTLSVTYGSKQATQPSGQGEYESIHWEPEEAWEITNNDAIKVKWRSPRFMRRSYKAEIVRDNISIPAPTNRSTITHGPYGTRDHSQILFKDKGHEIISKFSILERHSTPQSASETCPENRSETQPESLQLLLGSQPGLHLQPEQIPGPELEAGPCPEPQPDRQPEPKLQVETRSDSLTELVQDAAEDAVEIKSIRDRLGSSLIYLKNVLSLGDIVKDIHPIIGVSITLLSSVMKILDAEHEFNQKIVDLVNSMSDMVLYVADVKQFATIAQLKTVMNKANDLMRKVVEFFNKHKKRGIFARVYTATFSSSIREELDNLQSSFSRFKDKFDRGVLVHTMDTTDKLKSQLKELEVQLQALHQADKDGKILEILNTNHETRALRCLDGTRTDLISFTLEWARMISETMKNILWIFGYPGAGKSTLAMHVANLFREENRLGVIVEFNRTSRVDARILWKTIAYSLACEYRECRAAIVEKLKSGTLNLANATSVQIFNQLVAEPLRRLTSDDTTVTADRLPVIVIDALDECGGLDGSSWREREDILKCIAEWPKLAPGVRLIITSRTEQDIKLTFSNVPHIPLEIPTGISATETTTRDVESYMRDGFKKIATTNEIIGDWPGEEAIADLSRRAEGVFIWATTVLVFVDDVQPNEQLRTILGGRFPSGSVYALYRQILDISFPPTYNPENFVLVVGAIITLQQPFTPTELAQLIGVDLEVVTGVRKGLRTVLDGGDAVRFRHQSFVDFLTSGDQPVDLPSNDHTACPARFRINVENAHGRLCESLFRLMCTELHFNICDFPSSFLRNDQLPRDHCKKAIGRSLAYACTSWGFHLSHSQSELDLDLVHTFIHDDLLYWIEGLGGLGSLIVAVPSLTLLDQRLSSNLERSAGLKVLVKDAITFIRYFAQAIARSAPHVYISALPFAPKSSEISQLYAPIFKNVMQLEIGQLNGWPAEQVVIHGHSPWANSVAFSPDGKRLVSCSYDATVRVCDVETGEIVAGPFRHEGPVVCAVFSTDGKSVLSASEDNTIRTWNTDCGVVEGPVEHVTVTVDAIGDCAAFSNDRKYIALAHKNYTTSDGQELSYVAFVWCVKTGRVVTGPITGPISCVAFSPDDAHFATGSSDGTIRVWNRQTGELVVGPLQGHQDRVKSISYSHNGAFIASGSFDGTIRLWGLRESPPQVRVYEVHAKGVRCVSFSSDDKRIVSGSSDGTVLVWDVEEERVVAGPFRGHTGWIGSIAFSPDDKRIASGSDDGTVRVWDVGGDTAPEGHEGGHDGSVYSVTFSKDSKYIVSGSGDKTIRIWDSESGESVGAPLKGHEDRVLSVAYSPDGKRLVSGSSDETVRVWDVTRREVLMTLRGHTDQVFSVAYSNNGKYIASASFDKTNRVWNANTGECIHIVQVGERSWVSISFSPDSKFVVSTLLTGFKIWDVETGNMTIESRVFGVYSVTFSHDGTLVVTGSSSGDIQVWNATTGQSVLGPFNAHTYPVYSVAFSPDDKFIASGSMDNTVRIWETKTGQSAIGPFIGHTDIVWSVAFSHDGNFVISGSWDKTIRIWSTKSIQMTPCVTAMNTDDDGWVRSEDGQLLFWLPSQHHIALHSTTSPFITTLELLAQKKHGLIFKMHSGVKIGSDAIPHNFMDCCNI